MMKVRAQEGIRRLKLGAGRVNASSALRKSSFKKLLFITVPVVLVQCYFVLMWTRHYL